RRPDAPDRAHPRARRDRPADRRSGDRRVPYANAVVVDAPPRPARDRARSGGARPPRPPAARRPPDPAHRRARRGSPRGPHAAAQGWLMAQARSVASVPAPARVQVIAPAQLGATAVAALRARGIDARIADAPIDAGAAGDDAIAWALDAAPAAALAVE